MTLKEYETIAKSIRESFEDALDFNIRREDVREIQQHVCDNLATVLKDLDGARYDALFLNNCGV